MRSWRVLVAIGACLGLAVASNVLLCAPRTASAQDASAPLPAASIVKPHVFVSVDRVARGSEFQAAVVVEIARGYHMNSHKPTDPYLIPTTLTAEMPAGIELRDTIFPAGKLEKFSFSPNKQLDVYTGSVTLRLRLAAQDGAALGATTIAATLRYQACNDSACLPPVKVPVSVKFEVAAAGTRARAMHAEIFSADSPKN
jgi:DsbC/DsbD-like thiol-disulfide interchange protein